MQLPFYERKKYRSSLPQTMTNSILLEDNSQSSVSFAVSPSQKPLLIQAVFNALTIKHLVGSLETQIINL